MCHETLNNTIETVTEKKITLIPNFNSILDMIARRALICRRGHHHDLIFKTCPPPLTTISDASVMLRTQTTALV